MQTVFLIFRRLHKIKIINDGRFNTGILIFMVSVVHVNKDTNIQRFTHPPVQFGPQITKTLNCNFKIILMEMWYMKNLFFFNNYLIKSFSCTVFKV